MASKASSTESAGHLPPFPISSSDKLLSSIISLPPNPHIVYTVFTPPATNHLGSYECIELARRHVLSHNGSSPILESVLHSVHIDNLDSGLYVFAITAHDRISECRSMMSRLQLDGLNAADVCSFTPGDLYPCSPACSIKREPCPTCLNPSAQHEPSSKLPSFTAGPASAAACLLPRQPLQRVYSHFTGALRNRLIDDISEASKKSPHARPVKRYKGGFLLGSPHNSSEWGNGWEHHAHTRPLIHCHLDIHLAPSRIVIHPILRPTHLAPLPPILPPPQGTPISLLPYGTPAYFLAVYNGPTSALTTQFEQSLVGLGSGEWKTVPFIRSPKRSNTEDYPSSKGPTYIIAWINVQNKQGEDKGMSIVWPSRLAASYVHSSVSLHARQPLQYIPELPSQLQPSPPPPPPPSAPVMSPTSPNHAFTTLPPSNHSILTRPIIRRPCASPTSDSLRAFRTLTLSRSKDLNKVAMEIGAYVDSIAKERERERERIRKERENSHVSASPRTVVTPNNSGVSAPTTQISSSILPSQADGPPVPTVNTQIGPSTNPAPSNVPPSIMQGQHFYPSPPQSHPPSSAPLPGMESQTPTATLIQAPSISDPQLQPTATSSSDPSQSSYDPFSDTNWSQPATDFMDMDYEMGFDMSIDPISGGGPGGGSSDRINMDFDDDFGAFTDDDFSFFDRPSGNARTGTQIVQQSVAGLTPATSLVLSPPLFSDGMRLSSGPGPPSVPPGNPQSSSPWIPTSLGEAFSPQVHHITEVVPLPPDLLPPSPTKTSSPHSAPPTPNVQLSHDYDSTTRKMGSGSGLSIFDPIPFAPSHRIADGKYAIGKFALPSPPDEEDRTEPIPASHFPPRTHGWKSRYNAATDPRVGVVRKLIGVKRKSFDQGSRDFKMSPAWVREHEDWSSSVADDGDDAKSEPESEEEDEIEEESPMFSRPSTPLPSYLPRGPTLLHMRFHHSYLLPLSSPLRPPGAAITPSNNAASALMSVPTPVSPAAMLGAASEKSKSLEAAASMVAREVIENSVWADAWRSSATGPFVARPVSEVWQTDVTRISQLFADIPELVSPVDLKTLFEAPESSGRDLLQPLDPPMISIGKSDAIIQVLPSALRFWDKLGLGPRAGKKDIVAFVFYEDDGEECQQLMENWLAGLSTTYSSKHFGIHSAGSNSLCPKDGLVPVRFESFRKTLVSFISTLPDLQQSFVFYILTPASIMSLASPLLRQVFSAVKRALKTYPDSQILYQFVPAYFALTPLENSVTQYSDYDRFCHSSYNRILQPVDRLISCRFFDHGERVRNYFQEPSFALARPIYSKVKYVRQNPVRSLDVVDRHTFLHVGYQVTPCRKWLLAACVDQRGEAYDFGVWLNQNDPNETFAVNQIWNFILQFARKANVEWRIVISKLGPVDSGELDTWITHLAATVPTCYELPMMQVNLLSVESDAHWTFMAPHRGLKPPLLRTKASSKDPSGPLFVESSAITYSMMTSTRMPLTTRSLLCDRNDDLSFIPDSDDVPRCEHVHILPLSSATLIRVPSDAGHTSISMLHIHFLHTLKSPHSSLTVPDPETHKEITRNFHELATLSQIRWRLTANPLLPFHLAAVEVIHATLDPGDSISE